MKRLASYLAGRFSDGNDATAIYNPSTEEIIAEIGVQDTLKEAVQYARTEGISALVSLNFQERGALLQKIASQIHQNRDELIDLALLNGGNTRQDAKFDIDGASGTLAYYASLGESLGERNCLLDGEGEQLGRSPRLHGRHIFLPRNGVAIHINAFNFPAWGFGEKAACALLAGMPVITKPATATALVTHRICELIVEANILPKGVFQLLLGPVGDLFDYLSGQDVLAFTGSGTTGAYIKGDKRLVSHNVRVNLEADSLNAALLGPDVEVNSETFELLINDIYRDMTQKTGQKCTAIRRVIIPENKLDAVKEALIERLGGIKPGNPVADGVNMGPLATASQLKDVKEGVATLAKESKIVFGKEQNFTPIGAPQGKGYFFAPVLLQNDAPFTATSTHNLEVFGPVSTIMPYDESPIQAAQLIQAGGGGLVSSLYSNDRTFLGQMIQHTAPFHGRLFIGSKKIADKSPGPGTVLPALVHGGPGRAGAGEELGGLRGLSFYMQRTALEGDRALLDAIVKKY